MSGAEQNDSVLSLKGIGPAAGSCLSRLGITTISDLLTHYPRDYEDRSIRLPLSPRNELVNTTVEVIAHDYTGPAGRSGKPALKVYIRDTEEQGVPAVLVCFGRNHLAGLLKPGRKFLLWGKFRYRFGELQSSSFEVEPLSNSPKNFGKILPVYPLTSSLTQTQMRKFVQRALEKAGDIPETLPRPVIKQRRLLRKAQAVRHIHFPGSAEILEQARATLIYEELFLLQAEITRRAMIKKNGPSKQPVTRFDLQKQLIRSLPFTLTKDQETVLREINTDITSERVMYRLLEGDVGSGKTLVAFLACLPYIESGRQTALMVPTELLARQHAENAAKLLEPLGVRLAYLRGSMKAPVRKLLLEKLAAGEIDLVIGTHALFTSDVKFRDLGLVVVDEQHRFGVLQRNAVLSKGRNPDLITMTATPIPRTLALTVFGDMEVSTIKTMPPGRKPVETHLARMGNEQKVYEWVKKELAAGRQAFFVYPLIEETASGLKNAETMASRLSQKVFTGYKVGLIHSRLGEEQKEEMMSAFIRGSLHILVATSVVEVGVDIKNATCMVIEHAERFGLSALHQLRGRVGRSTYQSYAFLVYGDSLTESGKKRLKVMLEETDGFRIAEEDLKIRGPGDLSGIKQSGYLELKIADLSRDMGIMTEARKEVFGILERDPDLLDQDNRPLARALSK
jgi:ATP-dependent DNA helicase RecG